MQSSQSTIETTPVSNSTSAPEGFIDKAEVARRLGKTPRTVEAWTKKGYLPVCKVGRSCLYRWRDIEARLLENHGINSSL